MTGNENIEVYEVNVAIHAQSESDRLLKKKHFKSLPKQILDLIDEFEKGKFEGTSILTYEEPTRIDVYKLRLPNPDANAGKSNGYRVIYAVAIEYRLVVILSIYYKKEIDTLLDSEIRSMVNGFIAEFIPETQDTDDAEDGEYLQS